MEKKSGHAQVHGSEVKASKSKDDEIIHDFSEASKPVGSRDKKIGSMNSKPPVILFLVLAILGIGTGYFVAQAKGATSVQTIGSNGKAGTTSVEKGKIFGSPDEKTFKDNAEGVLREGGVDGEGAYHLERPGGDSQNVYLTSSSVDLSAFVGKKVKVWGETNSAQKAGWLMDVGRLQLL